jgi:cyclopropane fatty-acyl-phospholipid synthase-like methyltransferase
MKDGGYDIGYKNCACFWGTEPGSLLKVLDNHIENYVGKKVLDLGCGEGKNTYFLANKGCFIDAFDVSEHSIDNAKELFGYHESVNIQQQDVLSLDVPKNTYDMIVSYGLFHCFNNYKEVEKLIRNCLNGLKIGGYMIVCAFNNREQDLSAHEGFNPLLLGHDDYVNFFKNQEVVFNTDEDLHETHPHNNIPHMHSMTRLIIKKK